MSFSVDEHLPPEAWDDITVSLGGVPDPVDLVVEVATMISVFAADQMWRVDAMRREALADAHRRGDRLSGVTERGIRLELAAALRITEHAAGALIDRAEALVHRFPAMLRSLGGARTTERHAQLFVDAMVGVEPEFWERIVPRAVALAETEGVGVFRRSLHRLIETVRVETLAARHEQALAARRVVVEPGEDGMGWLLIHLPMVEARAIHSRVTTMAKAMVGADGETRTLDQVRADVVGDLLIDGWADVLPGATRGVRATVAVTVPVLTLLGTGEAAAPATVEGVGPVPVGVARDLCGGAKGWMRVLTHPETGVVVSVGRDRYRPPSALRRVVKWRAERCMAPGCTMPASRCDIDREHWSGPVLVAA